MSSGKRRRTKSEHFAAPCGTWSPSRRSPPSGPATSHFRSPKVSRTCCSRRCAWTWFISVCPGRQTGRRSKSPAPRADLRQPTRPGTSAGHRALAGRCRIDPAPTVPNPVGPGTVRVVVVLIGCGQQAGVLVAGSRQAAFPSEEDRLFLTVGANQTAAVLQRLHAEEALRESEQRFRTFVDHAADAFFLHDDRACRPGREPPGVPEPGVHAGRVDRE